MTKTTKNLKDLFALIDDKCEIYFYGNDGFDNQEKVNGKELLKKYIQDAVKEYTNQFHPVLPTNEEIDKEFPTDIETLCKIYNIPINFDVSQGETLNIIITMSESRRRGAKWMRDQIKNQLENKE